MCLQEGDINGWIEIVMHYYDKLYGYGNSLRNANSIYPYSSDGKEMDRITDELISLVKNIK